MGGWHKGIYIAFTKNTNLDLNLDCQNTETCDNLTITSSRLNCLFSGNFFMEKASLICTKIP